MDSFAYEVGHRLVSDGATSALDEGEQVIDVKALQLTPDQTMGRPVDASGYVAQDADVVFVGLDITDINELVLRQRPLGMTKDEYDFLCDVLSHAFYRENISDADVRLQGSSAHFFSSAHKKMPYSVEEVANIVQSTTGGVPEGYRCTAILASIERQWPPVSPRPKSRPFDSLFRLGVVDEKSDYDLQVCSAQMVDIVQDEVRRRGFDPDKITIQNPSYNFVIKSFAEEFFPHIGIACGRVAARVQRPVTWALFSSDGPAENVLDSSLSSHFKDTDWILLRAEVDD